MLRSANVLIAQFNISMQLFFAKFTKKNIRQCFWRELQKADAIHRDRGIDPVSEWKSAIFRSHASARDGEKRIEFV
ncbi:MAG: hypothetical protein ACKVQK_14440 [Burkholderiales bacterium]